MFRPISPGDFVLITNKDFSQYYQIRSINSENKIFISPPDKPDSISTIFFDNQSNRWKVYGTDIDYQIEFLSRNTYNEKQQQLSYLLFLSKDMLITIGIKMDLKDIINMCLSHTYLNDVLCNNQNFWRLKYIHDFDEPYKNKESIIDWKLEYITLVNSLPFLDSNYIFNINDIEHVIDQTRDVTQMREWIKYYKNNPDIMNQMFDIVLNYEDMPIDMLKVFTDSGFNINKTIIDDNGTPITLLEEILWRGNVGMAKNLIELGAYIDSNIENIITNIKENSPYVNDDIIAEYHLIL